MFGSGPVALRHVGWLLPWPQTNLAASVSASAHSGQGWPSLEMWLVSQTWEKTSLFVTKELTNKETNQLTSN
jgi:hypothetical protein